MKIAYQFTANDKHCVYVRVDPRTYEVFAVEKDEILPACPELGTRLKFGLSTDLQQRERDYKTNGVFCFFITLQSLDDTTLLEDTLKKTFESQRSGRKLEYLRLDLLKELFDVPEAKQVLAHMKQRIIGLLNKMRFVYSLRASIFTAKNVLNIGDGIAVSFTRTDMRVKGRDDDEDYQLLATRVKEQEEEKMVLAEENQALGKRARELEEELERRARRIQELEEKVAQFKRQRLENGYQMLQP
jgi:hypothetical protein